MSIVFIPLKSKGNVDSKSCICDWGQVCLDLRAYFHKVDHPLQGVKNFEYSNTCESQNLWSSVCHFIKPTSEKKDFIMSRYNKYVADKENERPARYDIAKHHFPQEIVEAQAQPGSGNWTSPMTMSTAEALGCYGSREKPIHSDTLLKYDLEMGEGKSAEWKAKNEYMVRKAPCAEKDDVLRLAGIHQNKRKFEEEEQSRLLLMRDPHSPALPPATTATELSSDVFIPLKTKGRLATKACICNWGQTCLDLRAYFDKCSHPLGGSNDFEYSNSCKSQNFWSSVCHFVEPSREKKDAIIAKYNKYISDKENEIRPRYTIAKHHFPQEIIDVQAQPGSGNWITPMTRSTAEAWGCYWNRKKPFYSDDLLKFNPAMGEGKSAEWKSMIRKAPCAEKEDVLRLAGMHQAGKSTVRANEDAIREARERHSLGEANKRNFEEVEPLTNETREENERISQEEERTPADWNAMLASKDYQNRILSNGNQALLAENQKLKHKAGLLDKQLRELKRKITSEKKKHDKAIIRAEIGSEKDDVTGAGWWKVRRLLTDQSGGLSRLTMLNDEWHLKNEDAAKKLWGYPSWEETKQNIGTFFPKEEYGVDTSYDPSKFVTISKKGELKMPELSKFEACLLCRLFSRNFKDKELLGLVFGRHRTRVSQLLKEWGPKWENVGEESAKVQPDSTTNME